MLLARWSSLVEVDAVGLHTLLSPDNRRAARESGLAFTVHGPYGPAFDPASPEESERHRTIEAHRRHAEAAAAIGAQCYVVHPDRGSQGIPCVAGRRALERSLRDLEEVQASSGVQVAVENMATGAAWRFTAPGDLDLGEIGLVLDTGHAAICGTLDPFLTNPRARLVHVHLHSNAGPTEERDPHRCLGDGIVDALTVLTVARRAEATVVLEHGEVGTALASIAYLWKHGLAGEAFPADFATFSQLWYSGPAVAEEKPLQIGTMPS